MEIKLSRKYDIKGQEIDTVNLDFENMTGRAFLDSEKAYKIHLKDGEGVGVFKEFEDRYALNVAATASGLKYSDFLDFVGEDYLKVLNQTKVFLNKGWESEKKKEEKKETMEV